MDSLISTNLLGSVVVWKCNGGRYRPEAWKTDPAWIAAVLDHGRDGIQLLVKDSDGNLIVVNPDEVRVD